MKKLKLLLLLCLTFSLPANGTQLPALPTYINKTTIGATAFVAITLFIGLLSLLDKKFKADAATNPVKSQVVKDFILKIAQKRNCNNITFSINPGGYSARSSTTENFFSLSQEQADELDKAITENNQDALNLCTGFIHHELTHLERNSNMRAALVVGAGSTISSLASFNLFNKYAPKNWNHNIAWIPFWGAGQILNFIFTPYIIKQHEEIKADEGIPPKKELLKEQENYYKKRHQFYMNIIKEIKTCPSLTKARDDFQYYSLRQILAVRTFSTKSFKQSSLLREIVFDPTHPSDKFRSEKFRDRIKATEEAEKKCPK